MNPVLVRLLEKGSTPTQADIAELLASVGAPGEHQAEKEAMVRQLFDELGHPGTNPQGFHVAEDLSTYGEF